MKYELYNFWIPGEPRGKGRHRTTKSGHTYPDPKTEIYENLIKTEFEKKYPDHVPFFGTVHAEINAYFSIPTSWSKKKKQRALLGTVQPTRVPDLDNIEKVIYDALNKIAFTDDSHVTQHTTRKLYSERPGVDVYLKFLILEPEDE